jgi:hypothetical protein
MLFPIHLEMPRYTSQCSARLNSSSEIPLLSMNFLAYVRSYSVRSARLLMNIASSFRS